MDEGNFENRTQAGRLIAQLLLDQGFGLEEPVVIALPRGGVPIGHEVAALFDAPLDILVVRKVGAPADREFGIGAVAEDGSTWINEKTAELVGMTDELLENILEREKLEIRRQIRDLRGERKMVSVKGRTVILCDDGIATGATALVAIRALRSLGAMRVVLATPVCAPDAAKVLEREADVAVFLGTPDEFYSVGQWYRHFEQLTDSDVVGYLTQEPQIHERATEVVINANGKLLRGDMIVPEDPLGVVVFAHGSGSSRKSPRNQMVARQLNFAGFATLLFDLLTEEESAERDNIFDIDLLAQRLLLATEWVEGEPSLKKLKIGYFGASTGGAAALVAASRMGNEISAVVARGGRPDLAKSSLERVKAPTLLIVGGEDEVVLELNREALPLLRNGELMMVPGAGHLFEEVGALEMVGVEALDWFGRWLGLRGLGRGRRVAKAS